MFAGDLVRMYVKHAEDRGWKHSWVGMSEGTVGGFKEAVIRLEGEGVFGWLKFERGVHRVQRVPATESQGRVHTSAATVAVLPVAGEVDVDLNLNDVRKDTFRASGAGGQHVNKTESAVRLTHVPTGTVVECQDGRSQHQNYERALEVLRSRLYDAARAEAEAERAAERKSQVSTGDRSAKIRTYNFPQGRVTDHRIGLTLHALSAILGGDLTAVIEALHVADRAERLKILTIPLPRRVRVASRTALPDLCGMSSPRLSRRSPAIALQTPEGLLSAIQAKGSYLCVGLDPDPAKIPVSFGEGVAGMEAFAWPWFRPPNMWRWRTSPTWPFSSNTVPRVGPPWNAWSNRFRVTSW